MGVWLCYYYKAWFGAESNHLLFELEEYNNKNIRLQKKRLSIFGDIMSWWSYNSGAAPELSCLACQLFGICTDCHGFSGTTIFHNGVFTFLRLGVSNYKVLLLLYIYPFGNCDFNSHFIISMKRCWQ